MSRGGEPSNVPIGSHQSTETAVPKDTPTPSHQQSTMPPATQSPSEAFKTWLIRHFGPLVALFVIAVALLISWVFGKVFGVLLEDFARDCWKKLRRPARLPKADSNIFTVAVAHLNNDSDGQGERLILEALREIRGIQVRQFDRTVAASGYEQVNAGHEIARKYLKESGAEVLIWGTLLMAGDKVVPKLYLTPAKDLNVAKESARYQLTEDLNLPPVFHNDLVNLLRVLVANYAAEYSTRQGHFIADQLGAFIEKVRQLLVASQAQEGWGADARAELRFIFANAWPQCASRVRWSGCGDLAYSSAK